MQELQIGNKSYCYPTESEEALRLWYGSIGVKLDEEQIAMLLYHALSAGQYSDDPAVGALYRIPELINLVNQSQYASKLGKIQTSTQEDNENKM